MDWIPFLNLAIGASAGGVIYDVLQVLAVLKILGGIAAWVAARSDYAADDEYVAKALGWLAKATAFVTSLASADTRPPAKRMR